MMYDAQGSDHYKMMHFNYSKASISLLTGFELAARTSELPFANSSAPLGGGEKGVRGLEAIVMKVEAHINAQRGEERELRAGSGHVQGPTPHPWHCQGSPVAGVVKGWCSADCCQAKIPIQGSFRMPRNAFRCFLMTLWHIRGPQELEVLGD